MTFLPSRLLLLWLGAWICVGVRAFAGAGEPFERSNTPYLELREQRVSDALNAARQAQAQGRIEEALAAVREALQHAPQSHAAYALALELEAAQPDRARYWRLQWARASVGPGRTSSLDAAAKVRLAQELELMQGFASCVEELSKWARERERDAAQRPESALVAWWARRAALELALPSPTLAASTAAELSPLLRASEAWPQKTVRALEALAQQGISTSKPSLAVEAARILSGLATQSTMKDLQGPLPPGMGSLSKSAADWLTRARAALGAREEAPWSVDELLRLDGDEIEAFTRRYSSFGWPAVALSPRAWYRIETDCGHGTLLGAAQTVELHHQRLAQWYGKDPFEKRPGLVRIVSEAAGLEAEGAPFWWVGGFQGGDTTVLRLSCPGPTIEGLGHGLTHELTHRFDGALFPGLPAWLAEGKAVWTGGAYGSAEATQFVENYASTGAMIDALNKGYGGLDGLQRLIQGKLSDYRDNYTAGHALYVYLRSNQAGRFRSALDRFQERVGTSKDPLALFTSLFCDGKDGRPLKLDVFAQEFGAWLVGFSWWDPKPWAKEYTEDVGAVASPELFDEPLWGWSRHRAEPRFGQGQALLAGQLLLAHGKRSEAVAAWIWALAVDGRWPKIEAELARALDADKKLDAAWCLRHSLYAPRTERIGLAPFADALPKCLAQGKALREARAQALAAGELYSAAWLLAEQWRLEELLGMPLDASVSVPALEWGERWILDGPSRRLGAERWEELGLTGYEERRAVGQWCLNSSGDLVLGMSEPPSDKPSTGAAADAVQRGAAWRDAVAFAPEWIPAGSYRIDCRVRFLTSYLGGVVVFGYREREDNLRLSFGAGDYAYAIGMKDKREFDFDALNVRLDGLRDRDGGLSSGQSGSTQRFPAPRSSAWLSLVVSGADVECYVDGQFAGRYHTVDGAPIEGRVGFAVNMGSVQIEAPRVTRLDRARILGLANSPLRRFDLSEEASLRPWDAVPCTSRGLPLVSQGSVLLWFPPAANPLTENADLQRYERRASKTLRDFGNYWARTLPTQTLSMALPATLPAPLREKLASQARQILGEDLPIREHAALFRAGEGERESAWLLFIDAFAGVRWATPMSGSKPRDEEGLGRWLRIFREHGRPPRELPELSR